MTIRHVNASEVLRDWDHYERRLNDVLRRTDAEYWPDDILSCIQRGTMQMWRAVDGDGIGVTELQTFPRYRQLLVYMVAGKDAQDWLDGADQHLEAFAQSNGCTRMAFHGRIGWIKSCRAFGYETQLVCMRKVVGNGRRRLADTEN